MGIFSLFSVLGGGAWLAAESFREMREGDAVRAVDDSRDRYVAKYTDKELEEKYSKEIMDVSKHEALWRRIEEFKRDNPVWCEERRREDFSPYKIEEETFGWHAVGKRRLDLVGPTGRLYGNNKDETYILECHRNRVVNMLLETHWKFTERVAKTRAASRYPYEASRRRW